MTPSSSAYSALCVSLRSSHIDALHALGLSHLVNSCKSAQEANVWLSRGTTTHLSCGVSSVLNSVLSAQTSRVSHLRQCGTHIITTDILRRSRILDDFHQPVWKQPRLLPLDRLMHSSVICLISCVLHHIWHSSDLGLQRPVLCRNGFLMQPDRDDRLSDNPVVSEQPLVMSLNRHPQLYRVHLENHLTAPLIII